MTPSTEAFRPRSPFKAFLPVGLKPSACMLHTSGQRPHSVAQEGVGLSHLPIKPSLLTAVSEHTMDCIPTGRTKGLTQDVLLKPTSTASRQRLTKGAPGGLTNPGLQQATALAPDLGTGAVNAASVARNQLNFAAANRPEQQLL